MKYLGVKYFKKSSEVSCRNPFKQDNSCIDYDQNSEDEWAEMNCDNLEDDELLAEEEDSQLNQDDYELKNEGFIVADDYFSQNSYESLEADDQEETKCAYSRRQLLKAAMLRHEQRLRSNIISRPFVNTIENVDLSDYKAVAFIKKSQPLIRTIQNDSRRSSHMPTPAREEETKIQYGGFPL